MVRRTAEIEHLIRAEVETVKAFLSRATDHYRPPYGRVAVDVPRQSVLIGTTNATEYLRDTTGNRRMWPVKCLSAVDVGADLDWLRDNRDQLWAEAAQREADAETIWLDDVATNTVAIHAQAARLAEDPWHDKVRDYIQGLKMTTVPDLFDHILFVPTERQTKSLEMRVAAILKSLGWDKKLQWNVVTKKPFKAWFPPDDGG